MFKFFRKFLPASSPLAPPEMVTLPHSHGTNVDDSRSHQARGNALLVDGKFEEAAQCYQQAIDIHPCNADALVNLAFVLREQKRDPDAVLHLKRAIEINPDNADAFYLLASLSRDNHQPDEAIGHFESALVRNPNFQAIYGELSQLFFQSGQHLQAEAVILKGLSHFPEVSEFYHLLATVQVADERYEDAIHAFKKATALQPGFVEPHRALGDLLLKLNRLEEALMSYNEVLELAPDCADVLFNQGIILTSLTRYEAALAKWRRALEIKPDFPDAHFHESLCRLQIGDYALGWEKFEWRWHSVALAKKKRGFKEPLWLGKESLQGKVILLYAEQGLGDTLQFCRYCLLLAQQGAKVMLEVQAVLKILVTGLAGVSNIYARGEPLPEFDYQCPLMSLPFALGTSLSNVPANIPYLSASSEVVDKIYSEVSTLDGLKIGICWKGGSSYQRDAERSPGIAPFKKLISHFSADGIKFYTLLPDSRLAVMKMGGEDLGHEVDQDTAPFVETAALIMNLDLIITCDTSIGHLAGALGKPVWLVLPFAPDWRWTIDREDTPWYPRTRLFRQAIAGDWTELFERVSGRLRDVVNGSSGLLWPVRHDQKTAPLPILLNKK